MSPPGPTGGGYQDGGPRLGFPPVTPVTKHLLLANGVIFLLTFALSFDSGVRAFVTDTAGLAPETWRRFSPFFPVWQLLTYGFLHSVNDLGHLLFNMLGLYFFGTMLEGLVGSRRFLFTYLAAVVVGGLAHLVYSFATGGSLPAVGASGGVLGIIVACAALQPNAIVYFILFPIRLKWVAGFIVLMDVFGILVGVRDGRGSGTAHWVHLGGAIFGFLWAWRGWIWRDPVSQLEARRARALQDQERAVELKVDDLLVKIQREGLGALSKREKDFLKKASQRKK